VESDATDSPEFIEQRRTAFGAYAGRYDAVRPSWPEPTLRWLTGDRLAGVPVVDLGAGTGKGTATLAKMGLDVTAVDPSRGMLDVLQDRVPSARVVQASAESIPLPDNTIDAIVCLQSWHWFDQPRGGEECARLLRPGGTLGLAWHVPDGRVGWTHDIAAAVRRTDEVSDRMEDDEDLPNVGALFGPGEAAVFAHEHVLSLQGLVDLASSWSYVELAPDKDERLAAVRAVAERVAVDGVVRYPYRTFCFRYPVL
jgi:SAM-dependent methyltransferase